jgi:signal transduction histidine kinase
LCCGAIAVVLLGPALLGPPAGLLLACSALVAVLAVLVPLPRGRITLPVAALVAAGLSVVTDFGYSGRQGITLLWMPFEFTALLVLTGRLVRRVHRRAVPVVAAAAATALVTLALPLRFSLRNPQAGAETSLGLVLVALLPVAGALLTGGYLRAGDERRRRAVRRARREQRLHMARVLHDFVAHELTGMLLEVQAAQTAPYEAGQHHEFLGRLEESGLRALDQLDRALHTLRGPDPAESAGPGDVPDDVPDDTRSAPSEALPEPASPALRVHGLADLPELVTRFAASGSVPAALDLDEELVSALRREADETAYSMVMEALTNVRRHGTAATSVTVSARRDGTGRLRVVVTDDGGGAGGSGGAGGAGGTGGADGAGGAGDRPGVLLARRQGGGTGLVGMGERFSVLGGELSAGPTDGGWQVTGTLPM